MNRSFHHIRLYGILDLGYVPLENCEMMTLLMLEGGVQILQLRAKNFPKESLPPLARQIAPICRAHDVPFIINDYPELVADCEADGVHVGQDDISVAEARRLAGPNKIVGLSTHSLEQALAAVSQAPDYIGFGPLFATPTKPDYRPIGMNDIAEAHRLVNLPIFCIGGIKRENLSTVIASGARRAVIVSGILQDENPARYTRECLELLVP
jgi:thiamine-phosphate pyrophosphorylase